MRTVADLASSIPWRGVAARFLSSFFPVLGFAAIVIGAFHLPGVWGSVGGWVVLGVATLVTHSLAAEDIEAMKAQAHADRIDRERERLSTRRLRAAS